MEPGARPGGSTGGGGAALAAGLTPLEFGSDIGGSIRYPAAWCGVYGHRPSSRSIPRSAAISPARRCPNPTYHLNTLGPLARSAEDLDARRWTSSPARSLGEEVAWRLELPPARHERLSDFRVAMFPGADWRPVDSEITAAIEGLAAALRQAGARVGEAVPEGYGDGKEHHEVFQSLIGAITASRLSDGGRQELAAMLGPASTRSGRPRAAAPSPARPSTSACTTGGSGTACPGARSSRSGTSCWRRSSSCRRRPTRRCRPTTAPSSSTVRPVADPRDDGLLGRSPILGGLPATAFPIGLTRDGLPIARPGDRAVPGGPHHDPVRRAGGRGDRRVPAPARLRLMPRPYRR